MNWKDKAKADALEKLDQAVPAKTTIAPKPPVKRWVGIGLGGLAVVACAIAAPIVIVNATRGGESPLITGKTVKLQDIREASKDTPTVSASSIKAYKNFYANFAPALLKGSQSSVSFSVFDAFVNFAVNTYFSQGETQASLLTLFGDASLESLPTAVKELTMAVGTPIIEGRGLMEGNALGGYSANSLWVDPSVLTFREGEDLDRAGEDFYLSLFASRPSTVAFKKWLEAVLPEGFTVPEMAPNSSDAALVSSYFLKRPNPNRLGDLHAYQTGERMDYTYSGQTIQSGYIHFRAENGHYYESETLVGGRNTNFGLDVYLPKVEDASPDTIVEDVVKANYQTLYAGDRYEVSIPYFTVKSPSDGIDLLGPACKATGSQLAKEALQKLFTRPMYLDSIRQYSRVNFDYDGFISESITVTNYAGSPPPSGDTFYLDIDRPFVFVDSWSVLSSTGFVDLPLVIGEVFDTAYSK